VVNPSVWQSLCSERFYLREIWPVSEQNVCKESLLLSYYSLDMTNTVFSRFQTQYITDFLSATVVVEPGFAKLWDFPV
jgi:hypothetical protein